MTREDTDAHTVVQEVLWSHYISIAFHDRIFEAPKKSFHDRVTMTSLSQ